MFFKFLMKKLISQELIKQELITQEQRQKKFINTESVEEN